MKIISIGFFQNVYVVGGVVWGGGLVLSIYNIFESFKKFYSVSGGAVEVFQKKRIFVQKLVGSPLPSLAKDILDPLLFKTCSFQILNTNSLRVNSC